MDKLLGAMKGKTSLNGWDVAVSYDLNVLSEAITDQMWKKSGISHEIPLNIEDSTGAGKINYEMKVFRPTLQFIPKEKSARLVMPLSGVVNRNGKVITINQGIYDLKVKVPIVGILSRSGELKTPEALKTLVKTPAHTELEFPPIENKDQKANKHNYHLIFHFGSIPHENWEIGSPDDKSGLPATGLMGMAKQSLVGWVSQYLDAADYTIARINNGADINTSLQPKSFMFTTLGTNDKPTLTIYMKVHGGSAEAGKTHVDFFNADAGIVPIPLGHSASIIISNQVIADRLITPTLSERFTCNRKGNTKGAGGEDGFHYSINVKEVFNRHFDDISDGFLGTHKRHVDDTKVNFEDHALDFRLVDNKATWKADFEVFAKWENDTLVSNVRGKVKISFHIDKTSYIQVSSSDLSSGNFNFSPDDVKITTTKVDPEMGMRLGSGSALDVPPEYKDLKWTFKTVEVPIHKINFLLTENIFASEGNLIELDTGFGIKTPHDLVLMGNVKWTK